MAGIEAQGMGHWIELAASSGEGAFLSDHCPVPVLVVHPYDLNDSTSELQTHRGKPPSGRMTYEPLVFPLTKRKGANKLGKMITIGRAATNDILLANASVSKFHAFMHARGGEWFLSDAGSTCGTIVDGEEIAPRADRAKLGPVTKVVFADCVHCEFLLPSAFYERLTG